MAMTISGTSGLTYPDASTQTTGKQACKAWVQFNGSGVVNASYNVSSVTRNAAGDYSVNFTSAMSSANYAWSGSGQDTNSGGTGLIGAWVRSGVSPTASVLRIYIGYSGGPIDSPINSVAVFR